MKRSLPFIAFVALVASPLLVVAQVKTGIDVLAGRNFRELQGKRVGLITNHSGLDAQGRRTIDLLAGAPGVKLVAIFTPEHGITGTGAGKIASGRDEKTGLPIVSLWGEARRPTEEMLKGIDVIVYDILDVGARFYTYISTLGMAMEAAKPLGIEIVVLDRPDPVNGVAVEGPVQDRDNLGVVAYHPIPPRYGMTIGELARLLNTEKKMGTKLTVIPMEGWRRAMWYDGTGLRWVNPSPNLRNMTAVAIHGGMNMLYTPDLSVGRATDWPYEVFGAPWVNESELATYLTARKIPGVRFMPIRFTPSGRTYEGQECGGVFVVLLDRERLNAARLGIECLSALWKLYPKRFKIENAAMRVGQRKIVEAIRAGKDPAEIEQMWQPDLREFLKVRLEYLIYK